MNIYELAAHAICPYAPLESVFDAFYGFLLAGIHSGILIGILAGIAFVYLWSAFDKAAKFQMSSWRVRCAPLIAAPLAGLLASIMLYFVIVFISAQTNGGKSFIEARAAMESQYRDELRAQLENLSRPGIPHTVSMRAERERAPVTIDVTIPDRHVNGIRIPGNIVTFMVPWSKAVRIDPSMVVTSSVIRNRNRGHENFVKISASRH